MIKNLIKNKKLINLILKHLVFKLKQNDFAHDSLKKRSHKLQQEIQTYLENKPLSKFLNFPYKGDYDEYNLPHNCGLLFLDLKGKENYLGQFKNGLFDGLGIKRFNDREKYLENELLPIIYNGEWLANEYHGFGQLTCEYKEAGEKAIEDTFGNFYFGKLNGFGKRYFSKKKSKRKDGLALIGYFEFDCIINFFLRINIKNKLYMSMNSGLYFKNKDREDILLHQFQSQNEITNLMDSASIKDEKLPSAISNYYKDYFDNELKSEKFKKLYIRVKTIFTASVCGLIQSEIDKNSKKYLNEEKILHNLGVQLSQSKTLNELEKIDKIFEQRYREGKFNYNNS